MTKLKTIKEIEHTCGFDYGDDFCPECFQEGKQEFIKDEIKFLNKLKKEFLILDDKIKEGMEDGQISILKRLRRLEKSLGGKNDKTKNNK